MHLSIELVSRQDPPTWLVHACGMSFSFSDPASAAAFAAKLEERVSAPHRLPPEIQKHWAAEHFRMLRNS
ncbi:hypothetical protein D3879_14485 [Pseudomonas cavernicola]|uniref:Uncharacterized protein n=1 Tax=Pseudomonas cavernicola TaxID=2320866 RepID=A0A418XEC9_9PSED|nr:hypothetical protein [Pseudomonas cavernicola]RJG10891.1 hypothetical protein D3879_14485 [Pseudomonas cavernicola]